MAGISIIMIFAMGLGGMLEKVGILSAILGLFVKKITSTGRLILSTGLVSYKERMDNLIATSHCAVYTQEVIRKMDTEAVMNVIMNLSSLQTIEKTG